MKKILFAMMLFMTAVADTTSEILQIAFQNCY